MTEEKSRMKRFTILILVAQIYTLSFGQKIDLNDTIIKCGSVCGLSIGDSIQPIIQNNKDFEFIKKSVSNYGIDGDGNGILVKYKSDTLFFLWDKEDSLMQIGGFVILNNKIKTLNGISIGSRLFDCVVKYNDFYLQRNSMVPIIEYYGVEEPDCKISYIIEFTNDSKNWVGKYKSDSDESEKTRSFNSYRKTVQGIEFYK
jgi:hypothetical protein